MCPTKTIRGQQLSCYVHRKHDHRLHNSAEQAFVLLLCLPVLPFLSHQYALFIMSHGWKNAVAPPEGKRKVTRFLGDRICFLLCPGPSLCTALQQQQEGAVMAAVLHPFTAALCDLRKQPVRMMLLRRGTAHTAQPSGHCWI